MISICICISICWGNHWDQLFSDGFGVRQPLLTMVFDGCAPLVRRWNGYVPSLKSTQAHLYPELYTHINKSTLQSNILASKKHFPALKFSIT